MPEDKNSEIVMELSLESYKQSQTAIDSIKDTQQRQIHQTYQMLSSKERSKYVVSLAQADCSQSEIAKSLGISQGRVSQIIKSQE